MSVTNDGQNLAFHSDNAGPVMIKAHYMTNDTTNNIVFGSLSGGTYTWGEVV